MFCPPSGGPCSYESRLDPEKEKKLMAAYSKGDATAPLSTPNEKSNKRQKGDTQNPKSRKGKQGRDIGRLDPFSWKSSARQTLNYIQTGAVDDKLWKKKEKYWKKKGLGKKNTGRRKD